MNFNGVVTFGRPLSQNTPARLPLPDNLRVPMLAVYWSTVGLHTNNGEVYFRQSSMPTDLGAARDMMVRYHGDTARVTLRNFRPSEMVVVTWRNVTFEGGNCTTPVSLLFTHVFSLCLMRINLLKWSLTLSAYVCSKRETMHFLSGTV